MELTLFSKYKQYKCEIISFWGEREREISFSFSYAMLCMVCRLINSKANMPMMIEE